MKVPYTRTLTIGGSGKTTSLKIGGSTQISVQTMWKEGIVPVLADEQALFSVLERIESLQALGCGILRFAVPDVQSAAALCKIANETSLPLVADIHFDWRLALECLKGNVAKIRINPGNIGEKSHVKALVEACRKKGTPIRIGVNAGSFPKDIAELVAGGLINRSQGLARTAIREAEVFEDIGFTDYLVSIKASTIIETIEANETFSAACPDVPLHIGVTEAGPLIGGIVKSTLAFSRLLKKGIGSTIRVSLSSSPENEIIAGGEILKAIGLSSGGVQIVSCPRCGRNGFDVHSFINRWESKLLSMRKDITVAVMGCAVNGPGEGKHADLGITGTENSVIIFKKGKTVRTIRHDDLNILNLNADTAFREELETL